MRRHRVTMRSDGRFVEGAILCKSATNDQNLRLLQTAIYVTARCL